MSPPLPQRLIALTCLALALMWPAWGDDTEIYTKSDAQTAAIPNVLLLLEVSDPMRTQSRERRPPPYIRFDQSLLNEAIESAKRFIDYYDNNDIPIRIGLMRYWEDHGRILTPVANLKDAGQVRRLKNTLDDMGTAKTSLYGTNQAGIDACQRENPETFDLVTCPTGSQDIRLTAERRASNVGALYEAWKYFQGETSTTNRRIRGFQRRGQYESPIEYECQKNHVVVFTDGNPERTSTSTPYPIDKKPSDLPSCTREDCLIMMAEYMREMDAHTDIDGDQHVETHFVQVKPIGGDDPRLRMAAQRSGGLLVDHDNPFTETDGDVGIGFINHIATPHIPSIPQQIGSQLVTRNQLISATGEVSNDYHIYYGLFEPTDNKRWLGNIKKYGLETDSSGNVISVLDKDDEAAVENGKFKADATSYWRIGNEPDGDKATEGGMADRLGRYSLGQHGENDRNVYTWNAAATTGGQAPLAKIVARETQDRENFRVINQGLWWSDNGDLISLNTSVGRNIPRCSGNEIPENERVGFALGNWLRGVDVCDEDGDGERFDGRPIMGGVQHSKPVVVPFGGTVGDVMLVLSNDGYLHILKTDETAAPGVLGSNPTEQLEWASIFPGTRLIGDDLDQTYRQFQNLQGQPLAPLNGDISIRILRRNEDQDLLDTNEGVVVHFGQRRGGNDMFSIFLPRPDNFDNKPPLLFWQIQGGATGTDDFKDMGETWSTPQYTTFLDHGPSAVLFGGGYDSDAFDCSSEYMPNDNKNCIAESLPQDSIGNAIYIVKANNGDLIWRAGDSSSGADHQFADMKYSFAAPLRLVDSNNDGHTDMFFAVDMGGQVWRFDIAERKNRHEAFKNRMTGEVIADLHGGAKDELHNRRFYNTPDVVFSRDTLGNRQLRINIGSGYRAHPLDTGTQDRMYSFVEPLVRSANTTTDSKVEIEDLLDITGQDTAGEIAALTPAQRAKLDKGWYLDLNAAKGEKVLSDPFTHRGVLHFTTYTPPEEDTNPCDPPDFGTNRLYAINFNNGLPVLNLSESSTSSVSGSSNPDSLDESDRSIKLKGTGIAPTPELVFSGDGTQIIASTEILDDTHTAPAPTRQLLYWAQDERE